MTARIVGIAVMALAGATASTAGAVAPEAGASAFAGHWRVAGVAVSDTGVQALSENDPSLMGKRLTFSATRLAWDQTPSTGEVCTGPQFTQSPAPAPVELRPQLRKLGMPKPTAFSISCRSGTWGPGGSTTIFQGAGGVLALPWYDGGLLKLVRQ